jgi:glycosyltransferase involved in cell wall biosynthesis
MHIAVVGFSFNHPTAQRSFGAIEILATQHNVGVDVVTVDNWGGYVYDKLERHEHTNFRIHKLRSLFFSTAPSQYRSFMPGLLFKLLALNPDIVVAYEEPATVNAFLSLLAAKILGKPFVCTSWENLNIKWFFPLNLLESWVARSARMFIAGTHDVEKVFAKKGVSPSRMSVLPLAGVDTKSFRPSKSSIGRSHALKKANTIVYVGRLIEMKGIQTILEARKVLRAKGKRYQYLFVGFGEHNDAEVVGKLEAEKGNDIVLLHDLERVSIPDAFNAGAICVYPSIPQEFWVEQFGYSVLESLACGVPVIASDVTGPRYIIDNMKDGILIPPSDARTLARKIAYLMDNSDIRKRFSAHAIIAVKKRFSNEFIARKFYRLLANIR